MVFQLDTEETGVSGCTRAGVVVSKHASWTSAFKSQSFPDFTS